MICAFTASCLLVLSLFLLLLQKARQDRQRYWDCMKWLGVTVLLSLVLFAMVGIISSALEISGDIFRPLHYPAGPAAVVSGAGRWKKLKHF